MRKGKKKSGVVGEYLIKDSQILILNLGDQ
jgi:hypothetical protein